MATTRLKYLLPLLVLALAGCQLPYYWQAAKGQADLVQRRQPIQRLLDNPATPESLRAQLDYVLQVRQFARDTLHLDIGDNYTAYADLERPYVVWNVVATPALSLQNQQWCFPIAGCVPYRGYFKREDADRFAARLSARGLDTYVGGVAAYSTLGWFEDAVLNTFVQRDALSLAGLLFHELAHRTLYLPGDATFNESFATAVEAIGLELWIEHARLQHLKPAYQQGRQRQQQFLQLVLHHRAQRQALFDSSQSDAAKQAGKAALIQQLRADYAELKAHWNGYSGYDAWFNTDLNNAQLSTVATYHQLEPAFQALFEQSGRDFSTFYQRCRQLAAQSREARQQLLEKLISGEAG